MPIHVTVTLDSGCFLPKLRKEDSFCEIGYFECEPNASDIKVFIDGEEPDGLPFPFKLCAGAKNCNIEIRHKDRNDQTKTDSVRPSKTFHTQLLHFEQLYGRGNHQPVERANFDCVIRLNSGHLRASMVKKRDFKEHKKQPNGAFKHDPKDPPTPVDPIAHDMVFYFLLADDEALELSRNGAPFWTSKGKTINQRLEIEIAADNSTAEKFYRLALKDGAKSSYFLPNQGDPPPTCPAPPCPDV